MNKYNRWYNLITSNAKNRTLNGYSEKHHIIPKSLGGSDEKDNLVNLTAREHFICHWLLTKIYEGEFRTKMIYALRMMKAENPNQQRYNNYITARVYENLKEAYSKLQSERVSGINNPMYNRPVSDELRAFRSEMNKGNKNPAKKEESRRKISEAKTGRKRPPFSKEWLEKMAESNRGEKNGMFGKSHNEETRQKMRERAFGRKQDAETIRKKADAIRGSKRERKTCPHCQKNVAVNIYARYHGDKCKNYLKAFV